jgi:phosphoribosyl-AMP cyclohydrolase
MLAYMNKEALDLTISSGKATYFSRSRQELWIKGETSGHIQYIKEIRVDCDNDAILLKVEQVGGAACHTGYRSCFFNLINNNSVVNDGVKVFNPEEVYGK